MKKDKAWLKEEMYSMYPSYNEIYVHPDDETVVKVQIIDEVLELIDQLDEPQKPVIPQFVADWIERNKQPDYDYENKEDALADSIHFALYSLEANYPETNPDVILRRPVNEWLENDRKNYWKLIDGVRYGYEVEKEKKYYIYDKSTKGYLGYNADKTRLSWYTSKFPNDVFTEQEIKEIDKRYWAFAEEVTK